MFQSSPYIFVRAATFYLWAKICSSLFWVDTLFYFLLYPVAILSSFFFLFEQGCRLNYRSQLLIWDYFLKVAQGRLATLPTHESVVYRNFRKDFREKNKIPVIEGKGLKVLESSSKFTPELRIPIAEETPANYGKVAFLLEMKLQMVVQRLHFLHVNCRVEGNWRQIHSACWQFSPQL